MERSNESKLLPQWIRHNWLQHGRSVRVNRHHPSSSILQFHECGQALVTVALLTKIRPGGCALHIFAESKSLASCGRAFARTELYFNTSFLSPYTHNSTIHNSNMLDNNRNYGLDYSNSHITYQCSVNFVLAGSLNVAVLIPWHLSEQHRHVGRVGAEHPASIVS
jgi:hypothetical protein